MRSIAKRQVTGNESGGAKRHFVVSKRRGSLIADITEATNQGGAKRHFVVSKRRGSLIADITEAKIVILESAGVSQELIQDGRKVSRDD